MYEAKQLAFIHAAGIPTDSRSHFDTLSLVDKGAAGFEPEPPEGWITRHLRTKPGGIKGDLIASANVTTGGSPMMGVSGLVPTDGLEFMPNTIDTDRARLLAAVNGGSAASAVSARQSLKLLDTIRAKKASLPPYDDSNGHYTWGPLSQSLRSLARVLKLDLGIETAVVDYSGVWDTHQNIPMNFSNAAQELSTALFAFTDDLGAVMMKRVTVVAMTEFGRAWK